MADRSITARSIERAVGEALSSSVHRVSAVHGGDTAAAFRVELADGTPVFAKTHDAPPPGFFTTEAWGLAWMAAPGVISVPRVLAVADGTATTPAFLVLEWIEPGRAGPTTEAEFGARLAALHHAGAPCFGRDDRRTTGSLGLPNEPCPTWTEFYAGQRLIPLARIARDRRALALPVIEQLDRLAATLDRFELGSTPARLHGDLWAGNRLVDHRGTSWLIDPACHGGHPEFDLAMMRLFGGFGPAVFEHYGTPADGWEQRIELHQIAPLVVHAIKFGGGYRDAASRAIARYV